MINRDDLDAANTALNAFTELDPDATSGEGPLADLTIGVKANIAVRGMKWTAGIEGFADRTAEQDAPAVAALREAGAAIIGTLNMEEAALGAKTDNPFFGATQNPHRIGYTPGGSSGGSGAAVAAGLCDAALGTDTMGSVRIPAAYCGIYGLKPTRGSVSQEGLEIVDPSLDSIGPLAQSLDVLDACSQVLVDGYDDSQVIDNIVLLDGLGGVECEPAVREGYEAATTACGADATLSLPHDLSRIRFAGFIMSSLGLSRELADMLATNPDGLSEQLRHLLTYGPKRGAGDLAEDRRILTEVSDALHSAIAPGTALLMPTAPQAAFPHADRAPANQADFTCLANIAGLPSVTIPSGMTADGLPVAVQLVGAAGNDAGVLARARELDAALAAFRRPELFVET
ncbi:amidase [Parasphingorhabdus marina]|nr:amidase [Parasphingorhabdus marina]